MPAWARPVRTLARSAFSVSIDLFIFCSVVFLTSATVMLLSFYYRCWEFESNVDQGAFVLAHHDAAQRTGLDDGKHPDRQFLVTAQSEGGGVHHLQVLRDGVIEADARITGGFRVLVRVRAVDAVN